MNKKSSSFLKRELAKLVDINMASDVISLDLNKLKEQQQEANKNA